MVVRKAAKLEKELHRAIIVLFDFDKHITLRNVRIYFRQGCPRCNPSIYPCPRDCLSIYSRRDNIRGVHLALGGYTTELILSGYAGDSAVYLRDRSAVS